MLWHDVNGCAEHIGLLKASCASLLLLLLLLLLLRGTKHARCCSSPIPSCIYD
jgi:hypothetical protein